jgi:hypothetical protein
MNFNESLKRLIDNSALSVSKASAKAGIGQASLYECLRGEYVLHQDKVEAVLNAIGADGGEKEKILRLRKEAEEGSSAPRPRRRTKAIALRERKTVSSFFERNDIKFEEDPRVTSLLLVRVGKKVIPVLALGHIQDPELTFGKALKAMLKTESPYAIVVTFIVEVSSEWKGLERFGIYVMAPNEALVALRRLTDGKPPTENGKGSDQVEEPLYF